MELASVTVVIPAYNAERHIRRAVESALAEPETREVIVCDDGSEDSTRDVVGSIEGPVTIIELAHQGNPAGARNAGIQAATTDRIAFLDADDAWCPGKLAIQVRLMDASPHLAFVCTDAYRETGTLPSQAATLIEDEEHVAECTLERLVMRNFVVTSSVLARRDAIIECGMFSEDECVQGVEDYDLWLRMASRFPFHYVPEPWAVYRDAGPSYRDAVGAIRTARSTLCALRRLQSANPALPPNVRLAMRRRRAAIYAELARAQWNAGQRFSAIAAAAMCVRFDPRKLAAARRLLP